MIYFIIYMSLNFNKQLGIFSLTCIPLFQFVKIHGLIVYLKLSLLIVIPCSKSIV